MIFEKFEKIPRLSTDVIITEKIDGTNGQIYIVKWSDIVQDMTGFFAGSEEYILFNNNEFCIFAGSRNRWLKIGDDNYGFANWVKENAEVLLQLGEGRHYGEWYGKGIQRGYGLEEKRFALFNVEKWKKNLYKLPYNCGVVPVIIEGIFNDEIVNTSLKLLSNSGSYIVPGFENPEGIVIFYKASGQLFKKTLENDESPKGNNEK